MPSLDVTAEELTAPGRLGAAASRVIRVPVPAGVRHAGGMDSKPRSPSSRRKEIDHRLAAVRARLKELRERRRATDESQATASERLEAAERHAAEAHAAAARVLASGVEAFRAAA
jgi:hypothetical protein